MKKVLLFFISLFFGVGLLIGVVRFVGWGEIRSAILIFTGWQGMIILLLTALTLFVAMLRWRVILKSQGYRFSNRQLLGPHLSCFALIYLFPMIVFGGELFRGYFLKKRFSVSLTKGMTSVFIDKILEITSFLMTILAGLIFFLFKVGLPPRNLGIILGTGVFLFAVGIGFLYFKIIRKESILNFFARFFNHRKFRNGEPLEIEKEVFNFFKIKKKALWQGFGLTFLRVGIMWLRCWVLILFLGQNAGALPVLSILAFYYFVLLIPIPMVLGSHEIIQTFSFTALGLGAALAPAFTMIQRGAELILALIGLMIFFRLGMGMMHTIFFRKVENLINNKNNQS